MSDSRFDPQKFFEEMLRNKSNPKAVMTFVASHQFSTIEEATRKSTGSESLHFLFSTSIMLIPWWLFVGNTSQVKKYLILFETKAKEILASNAKTLEALSNHPRMQEELRQQNTTIENILKQLDEIHGQFGMFLIG